MSARDDLDLAIVALTARGHRVPCTGRPEFTDENPAVRASVAPLRATCPVVKQCRAWAAEEKPAWGIIAGHDASTARGRAALQNTTGDDQP